jgi:hypothetical protein
MSTARRNSCLVARAPSGIEDDLIGRSSLPAGELELADQQLVEQRRIEQRVLAAP